MRSMAVASLPDLQLTVQDAGDEPFLHELHARTRWADLPAWGWGEAQRQAFVQMQCEAQRQSYLGRFPDAQWSVIRSGGRRVGRLVVDRGADGIRLVDIALLPEAQGQGVGTWLIRGLQQEAMATGRPLLLHVDRASPAQRLYRRLGFMVTGGNDTHCAMAWPPPSVTAEASNG